MLFSIIFVTMSFADVTYQGTLYWLGGEPVGNYSRYDHTTTTVDHIYFTVNTEGIITIDLLSFEVSSCEWTSDQDLNGDGEIASIDSSIYLFYDDGNLDVSDKIAWNGDVNQTDFPAIGDADGSTDFLDSYLSINLSARDYILTVGDFDLDENDAIAHVNTNSFGPYGNLMGINDQLIADHGDYKVTFTGDITITQTPNPVPIPGAALLLGSGLIGIVGVRRKFKK